MLQFQVASILQNASKENCSQTPHAASYAEALIPRRAFALADVVHPRSERRLTPQEPRHRGGICFTKPAGKHYFATWVKRMLGEGDSKFTLPFSFLSAGISYDAYPVITFLID